MSFQKDIFISYSRIDDEPLLEGQKGWVTELHLALEKLLAQLVGKKPEIWRDVKNLQGNTELTNEILESLPKTAILVSIIAPRYLQSEWCKMELKTFIDESKKNLGLNIENQSRVFKVIKTPVPFEQHPESIRDMLGYEFFSKDPETGRTQEFNHVFGKESQQAFWGKLYDLANDIRDLMLKLETDSGSSGDVMLPKGLAEKPITVYLAETSFDLVEDRDFVKRELQENGYKVLPDRNPPLIATKYEEFVQENLEACGFAIHLVGESFGVVPDGTSKSMIVIQNEVAALAARTRNLPRLIWMPKEPIITDERLETFVELIKNDEGAQAGADLLQTPLTDLVFSVHEKLNELVAEKVKEQEMVAPVTEPSDAGPASIYLICDQEDLDDVMDLEDALFDAGFEVNLPVFDGDEAEIRKEHEESLKFCSAPLLYYGAGNEIWVRSMMRDLQKIAGYGRDKPFVAQGVVLAGEADRRKERFRSQQGIVMNCMGELAPGAIQPFIDAVIKGMGWKS